MAGSRFATVGPTWSDINEICRIARLYEGLELKMGIRPHIGGTTPPVVECEAWEWRLGPLNNLIARQVVYVDKRDPVIRPSQVYIGLVHCLGVYGSTPWLWTATTRLHGKPRLGGVELDT